MFACNAQFSMHWGRQCAAPDALPDAGPGGAPKGTSPGLGGGAESFFSVILCWQNVKMCGCLLATPSFQCIGGGSVPPPMPCRTLGRAARRKARCLAFAEAPILFFSIVLCWQNFKICECLLAVPSFQCIGGGSVPPLMPCRTLGRAARRKARCLALAEAPNLFSLSYCVGKTLKSVNVCLQCPVFNASGAAVCRPRCLAGRWAGRRAKRRVAWPWRRPECNFLSCFGRIVCGKMRCRGKTSVAMQCTASHLETLRTAPLKTL